ncbi:FAD-linked oxidoreductase patO [Apiospora rasikravindrae]|uniref:FAD-linked oxidoreductase patO n=1 Tax=Apiospora rasikravindrae TaxID=990691 RepID=A0ABR1S243_9PEZI
MSTRSVLAGSAILVAIAAILARDRVFFPAYPECRTIPGDAAWPDISAWTKLNDTVGGKLIATVPIAAPCHKILNGAPNSLYDEEQCAVLRDHWHFPETHLSSPSSPMSYLFSNNTCNPWSDPDTPCTTGTDAVYVINATEVSDIQEGVRFATENNIRLVVRNTGHDYLGKSTGAHSLSIWTHKLKSIELLGQYSSSEYTGPAIKMGAGVESLEAYKFAASHDLVVAGGNCPTVAMAGGFIQGGGHGPLASKYGLAADTVLEMEVVTPTGQYVTASARENADLFWALRGGGGGGTFGIVTSATVKAFPDTYGSTASMMVANTGDNADALYSAIGGFIQKALPGLVDAGAFVVWIAAPFGFMVSPAVAPGLTSAELDKLMQPMVDILKEAGLEYQYSSAQHKNFLASFEFYSQGTSWNVSDYNVGGRLIARALALERTDELVEAVRHISTTAFMSGVSYNVAHGVASPGDVAAHPYFRKTLFGLALGTPVNYTDWSATLAGQERITHDLIPALERLTPGGGAAYLNEANFEQGDFQRTLYGDHYGRLLEIKRKYDPESIMYARTAVGSEEWKERGDGGLCRTQ